MKKPLACLAAATGIVAVAACSGGGGGGGGAERPNPGTGSGTLRVIAAAEGICTTDTEALATCQTELLVEVADQNDAPVNDAKVTFGPPGNLVTMTNGVSGQYSTLQTSFAASYHLSVVRGSADSLTGVVMVRPHDYAMTLAPDPPTANAPSKLTWSPSGAAGVSSLVDVYEFSPTAAATYQDSGIHSDDGSRPFTGSVFPESGTYQIQMGLATLEYFHGARPGSAGEVILARVKNVTVP